MSSRVDADLAAPRLHHFGSASESPPALPPLLRWRSVVAILLVLCLPVARGGAFVTPTSKYSGFSQSLATGIIVWQDRGYTITSVPGAMAGATFYRLAKHKSGYPGVALTITVGAQSSLFVCAEAGGRGSGYSSRLSG